MLYRGMKNLEYIKFIRSKVGLPESFSSDRKRVSTAIMLRAAFLCLLHRRAKLPSFSFDIVKMDVEFTGESSAPDMADIPEELSTDSGTNAPGVVVGSKRPAPSDRK